MSERERTHQPSLWELARGPAAVWLALVVLLGVSAGSAYLPLGPFNAAINLALAVVMIGLLAVFLMNLRLASTLVRIVAVSGLVWLVFMLALTFTDYLSRG